MKKEKEKEKQITMYSASELIKKAYEENGSEDYKKLNEEVQRRVESVNTAIEKNVEEGKANGFELLIYGYEVIKKNKKEGERKEPGEINAVNIISREKREGVE